VTQPGRRGEPDGGLPQNRVPYGQPERRGPANPRRKVGVLPQRKPAADCKPAEWQQEPERRAVAEAARAGQA
jgi:hypothetical protein